jgi:hypothetical protein
MSRKKQAADYKEDLRITKSLLVVGKLQERHDIAARQLIKRYREPLEFKPLKRLLIDQKAWDYIEGLSTDPKLVFCHPKVLQAAPTTSLYYRGMVGLSVKAAKDYFGGVESIETGVVKSDIGDDKALQMARTYNLFLSSIILNSTKWTLENGHRTILATMGISVDGSMRNRVGAVGEDRVRRMIAEWLVSNRLVIAPSLSADDLPEQLPKVSELNRGITMRFSSEPDIAFEQRGAVRATVEIKGGIDPAGALERYGAAKKSFEHAVARSPQCRNFYIGGVLTKELQRRIAADRLVEKTYSLIDLLKEEKTRAEFFRELFHHTLRLT